MIKLKELLTEWNNTDFKKLEKRWSKPIQGEIDGLTEYERTSNINKEKLDEHTVVFSKDEMAKLNKDGKIVKADPDGKEHTYVYKEDVNEGEGQQMKTAVNLVDGAAAKMTNFSRVFRRLAKHPANVNMVLMAQAKGIWNDTNKLIDIVQKYLEKRIKDYNKANK